MKEKMYVASSLAEVEELAVKELGVAKDDMYFDVISENADNNEVQVHVMVDANPVKKVFSFFNWVCIYHYMYLYFIVICIFRNNIKIHIIFCYP